MITGIAHIAIKTAELDKTVGFYREILKMVEVYRPPFKFPGVWMGHEGEGGDLIHISTRKEALDGNGGAFVGSQAIDHFAVYAKGGIRDTASASGRQAWTGKNNWCPTPNGGSCSPTIPMG